MNNFKKALSALAASAVLAPTLVACSSEPIVSYKNDLGVTLNVKCDAGLVAFTPEAEDAPQGFHTPEDLGKEAIKVAMKDNNPFSALAGPIAQGMAEQALERACGDDVVYTEPNEDGIVTVAPPVPTAIARGKSGSYKDGIVISVKDVFSYEWLKASNMFAKKVVAGEGHRLIVVDLNVSNNGKAPATLNGRKFQLMDAKGNRYDAIGYDMNANLWVTENRPSDISEWESVNPGSSNTETLIFRVPDGSGPLQLVDRDEYTFTF